MVIEDINKWIEYIQNLVVDESNIEELKLFMRASPERISKKLCIDIVSTQKLFNVHKKVVHNKIISYSMSKRLRSQNKTLGNFEFNYLGKERMTRVAVCVKLFIFRYDNKTFKFYPNIYYNYFISDDIHILFMHKNNIKIYMRVNEFYEYFIDIVNYNIMLVIGN